MLYQPMLLSGGNNYIFSTIKGGLFQTHWHFEMELLYCEKKSCAVILCDTEYIINEGEYIIISSAQPHNYRAISPDTVIYYLEFGSSLLGSGYSMISGRMFCPTPANPRLGTLMRRIISESKNGSPDSEWAVKAYVYEIAALLPREISWHESPRAENSMKRMNAIYPALEYIASSFSQNMTLEEAAKLTHYEKTAFCRAFRDVMGITFHKYLNAYRVEQASLLIGADMYTLSEIGEKCGIPEQKTFCRLFREYTGMTATEYRRFCRGQN